MPAGVSLCRGHPPHISSSQANARTRRTSHACVQVPASWGLPGLDEATAERLYALVKAQTRAGPQPEAIKVTYVHEWLEAAELAGRPIVDDPKVCGTATLHPGGLGPPDMFAVRIMSVAGQQGMSIVCGAGRTGRRCVGVQHSGGRQRQAL